MRSLRIPFLTWLASLFVTGCIALTATHAQSQPEATLYAQAPENVQIEWWSHWSTEPSRRAVIERIAADYEAEHPNVDIVITWWDKNPLRDAIRSAMTAGTGAPDITTFDSEVVEWVEAGWLLDLEDALPWDSFIPAAKLDGRYPGHEGNYKFNIAFSVEMLLYNPDIFAELAIEVPENQQFTQAAFVEVVRRCNEGGYAGVANAIGNRPFTARHPAENALLNRVGLDEFNRYMRGEQSWDTPEVRQVLDWIVELTQVGMWPRSFSTLTIDEYHTYFHTQRQACMLYVPTWYTGRAFKPEAEGGQSPDFRFGMLRYPTMDGAQGNNIVRAGFESGYAVLSSTQHPDVAKDILAFFAQPRYGALWAAGTNSPSAIIYDPETDTPEDLAENPWAWYWEEFDRVYGDMEVGIADTVHCGDFENALTNALNEGLPLGLISVDEAIAILDRGLCN